MEDVEKEDKATLDSKSIGELKMRLGLLTTIMREAKEAGDPRWEEAARQRRVVHKAYANKLKEARRRAGEAEPEPVTVGMQPARMKVKRPGLSGR